jgi:SAM-dependent methyltransferase
MKQNKQVTGLDLSEEMLKIAQRNCLESLGTGEIKFIKADYLNFPFAHQFDAACLMGFFDYIKDPIPVLLKLKEEINKEIYATFPKSGGLLAFQRKIRYNLKHCPLYLYSKNDVTRLMQESGIPNFEIKDCVRDWFVKISFSTTVF